MRRIGLQIAAVCLLAPLASAESTLRLPRPTRPETAPGVVYDAEGRRIGGARLATVDGAGDRMRMEIGLDLDSGERQVFEADLEPTPDGQALRPTWERTQRIAADGKPVLVATIDHVAGEARCEAEGAAPQTLAIEAPDRVSNVPLNLLFQPLARGEAEEIRFRWMLCREQPRILDASARVARWRSDAGGRARVAEIEFRFELGLVLSTLFAPFLPRIVFWLDPAAANPWLGHRFPLYPKGPVGVVLRQGVPFRALVDSD